MNYAAKLHSGGTTIEISQFIGFFLYNCWHFIRYDIEEMKKFPKENVFRQEINNNEEFINNEEDLTINNELSDDESDLTIENIELTLITVYPYLVPFLSRTIYLVPVRDHRYEIGAPKKAVRDYRLVTEKIFYVVEEPLL
ncbi:hypothetical protein OUZ56_016805 [Daphnia magna]|uniref:Uncharacterized protein n=1 Tax=Daphnia magna TaxID=35525 RepID=A0ABR0ARL3_9CRUS|nr:hypothetical protein OUZ56_016805 [Daphnia magna]